jgi:hypothetical protein
LSVTTAGRCLAVSGTWQDWINTICQSVDQFRQESGKRQGG